MIYLELFWTFFLIGAFTFGGGYAMLPLIQIEVVNKGWLANEAVVNFIAVSESTPGPFAINMAGAAKPDNAGNLLWEQPVVPGGPDGIFATVPVRAMADAICAAGLPGKVSNTAGTFVCNDTLYRLLHHFAGTAVRAGFIHVPFLPGQAKEGVPAMPLEDTIRALIAAIEALG